MPLLIKRDLDAIPFDPLDPAIDPLPKVWDGPHVSLRISEGFATLRLLPMNGHANSMVSRWPTYSYEFDDPLAQS